MISRAEAFELLKKHVESKSLLKHSFAVEAGMRGYAAYYGEDEETWASCGLLHDIDFEKYPDEHPYRGPEMLKENGYPEDFCLAVKGHADYTDTPRTTNMAKALFAVDQMSSFIVAVALMRPEVFGGLKPKSVKKKLKTKSFAAKVDREGLQKGAEELGIDMTDHIQILIDALVKHEEFLKKEGYSLIEF